MYDPYLHLFFTDDEIISRAGFARVVHRLRHDRPPVLTPDQPWEGTALPHGCVLKDAETGDYRMWYGVFSEAVGLAVSYATSSDGLEWRKPELDLLKSPSGAPTNIILRTPETTEGFTVLDMGHPGVGYRALFYGGERAPGAAFPHGIYGCQSDDGINWQIDQPATLPAQGDRLSAYWDPQRQTCMLLTRQQDHIACLLRPQEFKGLKREVALWESPDLKHWDYRGVVLRPDDLDPESMQIYSTVPGVLLLSLIHI